MGEGWSTLGKSKMIFGFQSDTYRVCDKGTGISVHMLQDGDWIEVIYEPIPQHHGEKIHILTTGDLVLILSTRLTVSLMVQPKICAIRLKDILEPLGPIALIDAQGINNYILFLCSSGTEELKLVQASYRLLETDEIAIQLIDVLLMQGVSLRSSTSAGPGFISFISPLSSLSPPQLPSSSPPPPPPPPPGQPATSQLASAISTATLRRERMCHEQHIDTYSTKQAQTPMHTGQSPKCFADMLYLVIDVPILRTLTASSSQGSFYGIELTPVGIELRTQSAHTHVSQICNAVFLTQNSILFFLRQVGDSYDISIKHPQYLLYLLNENVLIEYKDPRLVSYRLDSSLLLTMGAIFLCPPEENSRVSIIDFTKQLLGMQIRDPAIKALLSNMEGLRHHTSRKHLPMVTPENTEEMLLSDIPPQAELGTVDDRADIDGADDKTKLLLSACSPVEDNPVEDDMLRSYLATPTANVSLATNSRQPEHPMISDTEECKGSKPCAKAQTQPSVVVRREVASRALLQRLLDKYVYQKSSKVHSQGADNANSNGEHKLYKYSQQTFDSRQKVLLTEVIIEAQSIGDHIKMMLSRNQRRIQEMQTGVDNPFISLHNFMLSVAQSVYMWMKDSLDTTIRHMDSSLFPEKKAFLTSCRGAFRYNNAGTFDELHDMRLQLATFFIINGWSKRMQRALMTIACRVLATQTLELERCDPNMFSSLHTVLSMLASTEGNYSGQGKTKLTAVIAQEEDINYNGYGLGSVPSIEVESGSESESESGSEDELDARYSKCVPDDLHLTCMQLYTYVTLLLGLFGIVVAAEDRCYSVQGDQIKTSSGLKEDWTYNLAFPAYFHVKNDQLVTEAQWVPFVKKTSFSLPAL